MMKSIKRLFLQSRPIYFLILLIFTINLSVNILSSIFENKGFNQVSSASISMSIAIFAGVFLLVNSIIMITNCFPLALTMGATRKNALKDIYVFNLFTCTIISIFINIMLLISSRIVIGKFVVPYLLGCNWNILDGILLKLITLLLISISFTSAIMWLISGFKVEGIFNGLARILLILIIVLSQLNILKNYILWGQNQLLVHIILLITLLITNFLTYRTLIRYEYK